MTSEEAQGLECLEYIYSEATSVAIAANNKNAQRQSDVNYSIMKILL